MTSTAGAAIGGGVGFATSTAAGAGLGSAAGGAPCGACAAQPSAASTASIENPNSRKLFAFMFSLVSKAESEFDDHPGPLRLAVDDGRLRLFTR